MKTEIIKAIFTNLLFVIGVILAVFGFIRGTLTITRLVVFDTYPLASYEETRCSVETSPRVIGVDGKEMETKEDAAKRMELCVESLEKQRDIKKVEDIATSISTLVAGIFLILAFKRFILK